MLDAYLEDRKPEVSSPAAIEFAIKALKPHFGDLMPEHITEAECKKYARLRNLAGRKASTARNELGVLRSSLVWAEKKKQWLAAPHVWKPPAPPPRDRHLSRAEFKRLLEAANDPHLRLFIAVALYTAGRARAVLELTWDRVDLDRGLIYLKTGKSVKRQKGRATVPITETLRPLLEEARKGALTDYVVEYAGAPLKSIGKGFRAAVARAGIGWASPHVLRHTAAVWQAEQGVSMKEIAEFLGHSDDRVTQKVYARFSPEFLRRAARALD